MTETIQISPALNADDTLVRSCIQSFNNLMTRLRPADQSPPIWRLLQTLYSDNPVRFTLISSLHQNHDTDPLHYSVSVGQEFGNSMTIHINGWFRNYLNITNVTVMSDGTLIADISFVRKGLE
jgi:hypothetical protein